MNKTYLELASEIVTAMINRGYLRVAVNKGDDWKKYNHASIHTVGWALQEMYREVKNVPERAKEPSRKPGQPKSNVRPVK